MKSLAALVALASVAAAQAQPVGRLFFTPEERARLEAMGARASAPAAPAAPAEKPHSTVTLQGVVQREGGERIIWINGVPQTHKAPAGATNPHQVPVAVPGSARTREMKVGQTLDVESGQVRDGGPAGAVQPPAKSGPPAPP